MKRSKSTRETARRGLLSALLRDTRANVMLIGAAAVIPLIGMVGGAVDMSRAYLVKSRLQQACDAGTLAARKEMAGAVNSQSGVPTNATNTGKAFFDANFSDGQFGSTDRVFTMVPGNDTRLDGSASVTLPLTLMAVFGLSETEISVDCSAELNLPNIDVVLVLDQSGSMNAKRMSALREAIFAFYDQIHDVKPEGGRVRIGIVPYSGAVRVGALLREKNPNYLANSWTYQTREAIFRRLLPLDMANLYSTDENHFRWNWTSELRTQCQNRIGTFIRNGTNYVVSEASLVEGFYPNGSVRAACMAKIAKSGPDESVSETPWIGFSHYLLSPKVLDTSKFKLGQAVTTPTGELGVDVTSVWNDCIEERATVATTNFSPIPKDALDLDLRLIPTATKPETQWKPMWPEITYTRPSASNRITRTNDATRGFNCPSYARKLAEYPRTGKTRNASFDSYIKSLSPTGGTLHDIGMIWGAHLLSPHGIFGDENQTASNGYPISRHIVFMTDGEMGASPIKTSGYGNYDMDGRFAGFSGSGWSETALATIHNRRLAAICDRVKNENIVIWTVTFGLPQNQFTKGCASGATRAFEVVDDKDASGLADRFRAIAGEIAELRLVN